MGFLERLNLAVTWWNGGTVGTRLFTSRHGQKVGEDAAGNTYYQSENGQRRWVMFNGEAEASRIPAEWHGWLHHTWEQPPTDAPLVHRDWEKPHQMNLTGTMAAHAPKGSLRRPDRVERRDYEAWSPE